MNFNNATILSVTRKSDFFSGNVRYRSTLDLNVEGLLLQLTNADGVAYIISDLLQMSQQADNWQPININGYSFGEGVISSVNFSEGNDVRTKKYNVAITVPVEGDLSTVLGRDYSGLSYENIKYVEGFSESSSYDKDIKRERYSQTIKFAIKGPYSLDAVNAAKTLAADFFDHNDLMNTLGNKYSNDVIFTKFYTESYDSINNRYDFSRNYETSVDSNGDHSVFLSHSLNFDQSGIANVTEKAEYIGHADGLFDQVCAQARSDIDDAHSRCVTVFSAYLDNTNASLLSTPISKSFVVTHFDRKVNYELTFTNSNRVSDNGYFWNKEISVDKTLGENYTVSERGEIVGFGHIIDAKYNNALDAWTTEIKSGISSRLSAYYKGALTLKFVSESTTLQKVQGKINYSSTYSDSDSILAGTAIRKTLVTVSKQSNRNLVQNFNIINNKEIAQIQRNLLPNEISYSVEMNGSATTDIDTYLPAAKAYVQNADFISNASYSFDPAARAFKLSVSTVSMPSL